MANPTYNPLTGSTNGGPYADGSVMQMSYTLTTADATGAGFPFPEYADICVSATGTFGSGTVNIEGSNDGTTWVAVHNTAGTAATISTAALVQLLERPLYMRATLTGSTAATVTVIFTLRRATPLRT